MKNNSAFQLFIIKKVALVKESDIPSDVLERIDGYEILNDSNLTSNDQVGRQIYEISCLKRCARKSNNDTNESTRIKIKELYNQVKDCTYLMIQKL